MTAIALVVALALLTALAVLQILAASGLPLGRFVWGGQHRVLPRGLRVGSAVSVLVYAGLAALLLSRFDVVLLDEPTNDLDLAGLERLEAFVRGLRAGVVGAWLVCR